MAEPVPAARVLAQAKALVAADGGGRGFPVPGLGAARVGEPLAVQRPDGPLHAWFVPVAVGPWLAGFFQFGADGTLMRYASLQRRPDSLANCPTVEAWTDPATILRRAQPAMQAGETALPPRFSYDGEPSRLAWAVPLAVDGRVVRTLMVAGTSVWVAGA